MLSQIFKVREAILTISHVLITVAHEKTTSTLFELHKGVYFFLLLLF